MTELTYAEITTGKHLPDREGWLHVTTWPLAHHGAPLGYVAAFQNHGPRVYLSAAMTLYRAYNADGEFCGESPHSIELAARAIGDAIIHAAAVAAKDEDEAGSIPVFDRYRIEFTCPGSVPIKEYRDSWKGALDHASTVATTWKYRDDPDTPGYRGPWSAHVQGTRDKNGPRPGFVNIYWETMAIVTDDGDGTATITPNPVLVDYETNRIAEARARLAAEESWFAQAIAETDR